MKWIRRAAYIGLSTLLACYGSTPSSDSGEPDAPAAEISAPQGGSPETLVARMLGDFGSLATGHSPNSFQGDFDGDGQPDLLAVVDMSGRASDLPSAVRLVRPWPPNAGVKPAEDLTQGSRIGLVVVHGVPGDPEAYLLHDLNAVSILDTDAARVLLVVPHSDLAALEEPELAAAARGDVIAVPTESGIDTYLYWDGSTYRAFEPAEVP